MSISFTRTSLCLLTIFTLLQAKAQVSVVTQHNNLDRTGWNDQETILTHDNVMAGKFGKVFTRSVDDQVYAQPLILSQIVIGGGIHNILIVATVSNTVYAFDADSSGSQFNTPYWQVNLTPAGSRPVRYTDMSGACGGNYLDFQGNIGIVGTPVIDPNTLTIYLVTRSVSGNVYKQHLHALDISTGAERANSPVEIKASVNGRGQGNINGVISFDPQKQNQRPGLLLLNGIVYIGYSSHCDWRPYHGWLLGYDASSLQQKVIYNTTPEGADGGIWMSAGAPSADELGNIYLSVGNGTVGYNNDETNPVNRGESLLQLKPNGSTLSVQSYFTPKNYEELEATDLDFGVTEAMLIPNSPTIITGCKDGSIYVTDRNNMGGYNKNTNQLQQTISLNKNNHLRSSFAYYKGTTGEYTYAWSENGLLKALPYNRTTNLFDLSKIQSSGIVGPGGNNGAFMSVSSNGSDDHTAILWATYANNCDAIRNVCPGILRAIDATNVNHELWNSHMNADDDLGNFAKFVCPTVANGKVYMATFSNKIVVYGLIEAPDNCPAQNIALTKPAVASSQENNNTPASLAFDGDATTRWSSKRADPQWIYVDLQDNYDLCRVVLKWETARAQDFDIQVSDDAVNWTTVQSITGNTSTSNIINLNTSGRYVRIYGTKRATTFGYSLYEFEVYGKLKTTQCAAPDNLTATTITDSSATLHWKTNGATSYSVQYKSVSASVWNTQTTTNDSLVIKGLSCQTDYLFQVAGTCKSSSSDYSITSGLATKACLITCGFLPTRWNSLDIGNVQTAGLGCFDKDTFLLKGEGNISGTADAFRLVYTDQAIDAQYIAYIKPLSTLNTGNLVGLMLREDLTSGAKNAFVALSGSGSAVFQYRKLTDQGSTVHASVSGITYPVWVKLLKTGTLFSAFTSADGITWKTLGNPVDLGFGSGSYYIGLAAASLNSDGAVTSQATFTSAGLDILPETFKRIKAESIGNKAVKLTWEYDNIPDNDHFAIERSADGFHFTEIAQVRPHANSSLYEYRDDHPVIGTAYYRVKQISINNNFEYSTIVQIKLVPNNSIMVYPNPVRESFEVISKAGAINSVQIMDITGRVIKNINFGGNSGSVTVSFNKEQKGIYMLQISTTTGRYQVKMVK